MKMIMAVIQDRDVNELLKGLAEIGQRATKLASSGGFLRSGNSTMMIGTEDEKLEEVLAIIRRTCQDREHFMPATSPAAATGEPFFPFPATVKIGGAIVFVLEVARFEKW